MAQRVYGLPVDFDSEYTGTEINNMTREERFELVAKHEDEVEEYTIEAWFEYLNSEMIDTENMWWFIA